MKIIYVVTAQGQARKKNENAYPSQNESLC